jgi:hypothetical protein
MIYKILRETFGVIVYQEHVMQIAHRLAGYSLGEADLLRAEAATGKRHGQKAVINIFLAGGPPHQDMWDIKTEAPPEIRGEFRPVATSVPGIEICEHLPDMAGRMDRFALIPSIIGAQDDHNAFQCYTGRDQRKAARSGSPGFCWCQAPKAP